MTSNNNTVFDLNGVAGQIYRLGNGLFSSRYEIERELRIMLNDKEIETPTPAFQLNETSVWDAAGVADWLKLYKERKAGEEKRHAEKLVQQNISLNDLLDKVISNAKSAASRNGRAYSHNRGNSLKDARIRVMELDGQWTLIGQFFDAAEIRIPTDKRTEYNEAYDKAARAAGVK